jgi:hypothetical protein
MLIRARGAKDTAVVGCLVGGICSVDDDRPITRRDEDRLGFAPIAEHLARAIAAQSAMQGFVFGIEGRWGSGKTTLINLTIEALKAYAELAPEVVIFSPWLVGKRDELLQSLFDELADVAVKIDPIVAADSTARTQAWSRGRRNEQTRLRKMEQLRKSVGSKLKAFGAIAGGVGQLEKAVDTQGVPLASVSKRKAELVDALRLFSRRVVVFIDDLDRLEPREASEILRLIRAVADFPNIIYVLSYDPQIMAQILSKAVQVDDGAAFLEKIVQVSFRVPRPEAFDLRRWLQAEVYRLFPGPFDAARADEGSLRQRLARAIDIQGGRYLRTGRDLVRVLNALRLHAIPVQHFIDVADMVWLQLVRIGNPDFYSWVEEYLVEVAAVAGGARMTDGTANDMRLRLEAIFRKENTEFRYAIELAGILPGVDCALGVESKPDELQIFKDLNREVIDRFVAFKGLGSPQHYRYYFAFSQPAGALPDEEAQAFIDAAQQSPADALVIFRKLSREVRPQGGTSAELLIDRLNAWADRIPTTAVPGIFRAFAQALDADEFSSGGDFGERTAWGSATRLTKVLLGRMTPDVRATGLRVLFTEGRALGWLTSIIRGEIFAHGYYGNQATPESGWLLSADEFNSVRKVMLERYRATPAADLMRVPELVGLLYAWLQGGGQDAPKVWVESQTATNAGLLDFLSRARGWAATKGVVQLLKRGDLERFLDFDLAVLRLKAISNDVDASAQAERELASELLAAMDHGKDR